MIPYMELGLYIAQACLSSLAAGVRKRQNKATQEETVDYE